MSHILEVDHSKTRASKRRIERAPDGRITSEQMAASPGQYEDLGRELAVVVDGEVRFEPGDRALYATDASNYRQVPIGVVIPRSAAAVATTIELCRKFEAPIVMRGGGTSLAGQGCNFAVLIDCSKYTQSRDCHRCPVANSGGRARLHSGQSARHGRTQSSHLWP